MLNASSMLYHGLPLLTILPSGKPNVDRARADQIDLAVARAYDEMPGWGGVQEFLDEVELDLESPAELALALLLMGARIGNSL